MKGKLVHPLWTHLPALLLIVVAAFFTVKALPLPDPAPVRFDLSGQPNTYGSPWISSSLLLGLSVGFLILSLWLDELWARQEKKKTFNWMSLFDEFAIGSMCGVQIAYVNMLASAQMIFPFPWVEMVTACGLGTGLAVVLELIRPYRHYEKKPAIEDVSQVAEEITRIIQAGQPVSYWESQNPPYVGALMVIVPLFPFPWVEMVTACGLGTGLAVVLELIRPYRHYEKKSAIEDVSQVAEEITRIIQAGQPVSYWESQNPPYVGALMVIVPLIMIVAAVFTWASLPWLSIILGLIAVAMIGTYGGFRTQVTRDMVTVRMGLLGIKLLQLKTADITGVEVHSFSPLREFGGYGIRFNSEMKAYYLRGDRGVKITAGDGQKYLIGSDRPEHLAAVIDLVRG